MNITVIYGSEKRGSTYNIAQLFIKNIKNKNDSVTEFFLPRDMNKFCIGCSNCFAKGESFCPHFKQVEPILYAIENADFLIFTTPVYALRTSGQMKVLLDHFSFLFMTHRPSAKMFSKTALIISTGAGGGTKAAINDIAISLKFWGIAKIYKFGKAVYAADWGGVSDKNKQRIIKDSEKLSEKIRNSLGKEKPDMVTKILFNLFRIFHMKICVCEYDDNYWHEKGWLKNKRPWK